MIFLCLSRPCFPSELIANDNFRKGHNGDSTNNLRLGFANLNVCTTYQRVMDDYLCLHIVKIKLGSRKILWASVGLRLDEQFIHDKVNNSNGNVAAVNCCSSITNNCTDMFKELTIYSMHSVVRSILRPGTDVSSFAAIKKKEKKSA